MNKKMILVALIGGLVGQSVVAMDPVEQEKKPSLRERLLTGKNLAIGAGLGGLGTAAYYGHKRGVFKDAAALAQIFGGYYGGQAWEYAKANPKKVAGYSAATVFAGYGLYKWYNRKGGTESKLEEPTLGVDDLLAGKPGSKHEQDALKEVPVWLGQLLGLLRDVYGDDTATIEGYLKKAAPEGAPGKENPHVLFQDAALLEKMSKDQKIGLFVVATIFTAEYMGGKARELAQMLTKEQEFVLSMLQEAVKSGDVKSVIDTFAEFTDGDADYGLTEAQTTLVTKTNEFVQECFIFQKFFLEDNDITLN